MTDPSSDLAPADSERIRLIVLYGGESAEHDISCLTATHVLAAIEPDRYDVHAVGITKHGQWTLTEGVDALLGATAHGRPTPSLTPQGPTVSLPGLIDDAADQPVVVLPLLHGPLGEDGTVQGMMELANVAYVGAGVLGSALAMDKAKAKEVLAAAGIPQTRWRSVFEPQWDGDTEPIIDDLGLPVFVKPANMGSSVGVSKASSATELIEAMRTAFRYDEWIVIEEAVTAREIEFAVLGNTDLAVSCAGEIIPGAEFYDYEDKYFSGAAELRIPAVLDAAVESTMADLAKAAFQALRIEGLARADFFYEESGRGPLVNELNTMPGFTPSSMYPKLWEASGLRYPDLIDRLVALAQQRHQRRQNKRLA